MTRKSKREIERALDDVGGETAVDEWVQSQFREGFDVRYEDTTPLADEILVAAGGVFEMYIDRDSVPGWVDVEADLPVRA